MTVGERFVEIMKRKAKEIEIPNNKGERAYLRKTMICPKNIMNLRVRCAV